MDVQEGHESKCVFKNILHTCRGRSDSEFRQVNVESLKEASQKIQARKLRMKSVT